LNSPNSLNTRDIYDSSIPLNDETPMGNYDMQIPSNLLNSLGESMISPSLSLWIMGFVIAVLLLFICCSVIYRRCSRPKMGELLIMDSDTPTRAEQVPLNPTIT
jgi:hypothetical protein